MEIQENLLTNAFKGNESEYLAAVVESHITGKAAFDAQVLNYKLMLESPSLTADLKYSFLVSCGVVPSSGQEIMRELSNQQILGNRIPIAQEILINHRNPPLNPAFETYLLYLIKRHLETGELSFEDQYRYVLYLIYLGNEAIHHWGLEHLGPWLTNPEEGLPLNLRMDATRHYYKMLKALPDPIALDAIHPWIEELFTQATAWRDLPDPGTWQDGEKQIQNTHLSLRTRPSIEALDALLEMQDDPNLIERALAEAVDMAQSPLISTHQRFDLVGILIGKKHLRLEALNLICHLLTDRTIPIDMKTQLQKIHKAYSILQHTLTSVGQ